MRILHVSDLHIGKSIKNYSLVEEQKHMLNTILDTISKENIELLVVAGDVYDRAIPSTEAMELLDDFLTQLKKKKIYTVIVSGNHDSSEKLAYASRFMKDDNIYISKPYTGTLESIILNDEYGDIEIYLLPFINPSIVKNIFCDEEINTYTDAVKKAISCVQNSGNRKILVAHQFISGAQKSNSENKSTGCNVGTLDNVEPHIFSKFDYVALGHIHKSQTIMDKIHYCGTMLKYSKDEAGHQKTMTIVNIEKKDLKIEKIDYKPLRDIKLIKGKYEDIIDDITISKVGADNYIFAVIQNEETVNNLYENLKNKYPYLCEIEIDNSHTKNIKEAADNFDVSNIANKSHMEIALEFYNKVNNTDMNDYQKFIVDLCLKECENEVN